MNSKQSPRFVYPILIAITSLIFYAVGVVHGPFVRHRWPFTIFAAKLVEGRGTLAGHVHGEGSHEHHEDEHTDGVENSLELSETARKNVGLTEEFLKPIELTDYEQTIPVPAIIVDRPGRTRLPVSAATTGIITHVHAVTGEAIAPGDLILEIRLTHEDLVTSQREFLQALGDRDVEVKEITRIESVAIAGGISNKTLLERQYSRDKLESLLKSHREALRLHGLSETQIAKIEADRRLLTEIKVLAPDPDRHAKDELQLSRQESPNFLGAGHYAPPTNDRRISDHSVRAASFQPEGKQLSQGFASKDERSDDHAQHSSERRLLILQDLHAQKGQVVNAGELLCCLADFGELLIEGQAFETEAGLLSKAKQEEWMVSAITEESGQLVKLPGLTLSWVDNEIDPSTRALKFYVELPNVTLGEHVNQEGQRHITWRYRTGQRMQLLVPVKKWTEQIVLPVDAVVREGIESFVFQQNGDHYDRVAVHERFRDQSSVVIENDGALYPGDIVALRGAHQMQMALKNRSGGAIDPHEGHSH